MTRCLALASWILITHAWCILGCDETPAGTDSVLPPNGAGGVGGALPDSVLDLGNLDTSDGGLLRVYGSSGFGFRGVPVAAGDCDGDGQPDLALAAFQARPFGRNSAGEVHLAFGNGTTFGTIDSAPMSAGVLKIGGAGELETLGNEVWIDDVTGDGIADLLLCRQNFQPDPGRAGAGALSILVGGSSLRAQAETLTQVDMAAPPPELTLTTFVGAAAIDRLGIWVRTADVTGDGVRDIIVGADQEDTVGVNSGAVYVIRGGDHLASNQTIDLALFGNTPLAGHIAKILPPGPAAGYHLGATCAGADLDDNGRAEVLVAAALNRSGAAAPALGTPTGSAEATGGTANGTVWIAWDDNFPQDSWPAGFTVFLDSPPGAVTTIDGSSRHESFGEEMNGGVDFDGDQRSDLFVGDLKGDLSSENRSGSGVGHVFYDAAALRGLAFDMDELPPEVATTTILGAASGDISSDTSVVGDFDGDALGDLVIGSPSADPLGRRIAGTIHVLFGRDGRWPARIDLRDSVTFDENEARIATVIGANGSVGADRGDMICYSAAGGDIDGDGRDDIISNEMLGNGVDPGAIDVGNLIVISGEHFR